MFTRWYHLASRRAPTLQSWREFTTSRRVCSNIISVSQKQWGPALCRSHSTTTPSKINSGLTEAYQDLLNNGVLSSNSAQAGALAKLDVLSSQLNAHSSSPTSPATTNEDNSDDDIFDPKGVYIHGPVGCGKSVVMDLFYDHAATNKKQRHHFDEFVQLVHQDIHQYHYPDGPDGERRDGDPIPPVADYIIDRGTVLCLDEMQMTDVTNAVLFTRLFKSLSERGAIFVFTSNRPPSDLYLHGIKRGYFLDFIRLLEDKCEVVAFPESASDYRIDKESWHQSCFFGPSSSQTQSKFNDLWENQLDPELGEISAEIPFRGRTLHLPRTNGLGMTRCTFTEMCESPLGPADYRKILEVTDVLFIEDVPAFTLRKRDAVRRFITLIDQIYEAKALVVCLSHHSLNDLDVKAESGPRIEAEWIFETDLSVEEVEEIKQSALFDGQEDIFAFKRCISRLHEMQSAEYHTDAAALRDANTLLQS